MHITYECFLCVLNIISITYLGSTDHVKQIVVFEWPMCCWNKMEKYQTSHMLSINKRIVLTKSTIGITCFKISFCFKKWDMRINVLYSIRCSSFYCHLNNRFWALFGMLKQIKWHVRSAKTPIRRYSLPVYSEFCSVPEDNTSHLHRGSYRSAPVLLNLLNHMGKSNKMWGLSSI